MYSFPVAVFSALAAVSVLVSAQAPARVAPFVPADNFLIDCGGSAPVISADGRSFMSDSEAKPFLTAGDDVPPVSVPSAEGSPSPIYLSARIFREEARYGFPLKSPGWHWIRLHFFPLDNPDAALTDAVFSVLTDDYVLLHSFTPSDPNKFVLKEYLFNATTDRLTLKFTPMRDSVAFINGIEVVSAPDVLIGDEASNLSPVGPFQGLSTYGYQTAHRVNVGGAKITSTNDTLGRQWATDEPFMQSRSTAKRVAVSPAIVKYGEGVSPLIAPSSVYASAARMEDARVGNPNFNISWNFDVDPSFAYLVRLHFCDIVSKAANDLYFNVYVNAMTVAAPLDLSTITDGDLASAYFKDVVVNPSVASDRIVVQVGPLRDNTRTIDAILNGVEILKMSNSVKSLDGEFGVDGRKADDDGGGKPKAIAMVGIAMGFGALAGVAAMTVKWYKRPQDWQRRNSFSSWLLPIHTNQSSFTSSKGSGYGSNKTGVTFSSTLGLGRYFSFAELCTGTAQGIIHRDVKTTNILLDENFVAKVSDFGLSKDAPPLSH